VYDSTGVMYKVPEWLIVQPDGLVAEDAANDTATEPVGAIPAPERAQDVDEGEDDEPVLVRARISRNGRDIVLKLRKNEPVASIVDKIRQQAEVRLSLRQHGYIEVRGRAKLTITAGCINRSAPRLWRTHLSRP
jgi:hypothetical protein